VIKKNFYAGCDGEISKLKTLLEDKNVPDYEKKINNAMKAILESPSKSINIEVFRKIVGETKHELFLRPNVFAYHPDNSTVTFQSKLMLNYVEEKKKELGL
jgi:hypothetical protein